MREVHGFDPTEEQGVNQERDDAHRPVSSELDSVEKSPDLHWPGGFGQGALESKERVEDVSAEAHNPPRERLELSEKSIEGLFRFYSERQDQEVAELTDDERTRQGLAWSGWENMAEELLAASFRIEGAPYKKDLDYVSMEQRNELEVRLEKRRNKLIKDVVNHWREAGLL